MGFVFRSSIIVDLISWHWNVINNVKMAKLSQAKGGLNRYGRVKVWIIFCMGSSDCRSIAITQTQEKSWKNQ